MNNFLDAFAFGTRVSLAMQRNAIKLFFALYGESLK